MDIKKLTSKYDNAMEVPMDDIRADDELRYGRPVEQTDQIKRLREIIKALIEAARPVVRRPELTSEESALYDVVFEATQYFTDRSADKVFTYTDEVDAIAALLDAYAHDLRRGAQVYIHAQTLIKAAELIRGRK